MAEPRDFVAEAKAAVNAADQSPLMIAAVIYAQAMDRLAEAQRANTEALDNNSFAVRDADSNAHHRWQNR